MSIGLTRSIPAYRDHLTQASISFVKTRKYFGTYSSLKVSSIVRFIGLAFVILYSIISKVAAFKIIFHYVCSDKWQPSDREEDI